MTKPLRTFWCEIDREYQTGITSELRYYDEIQELLKECTPNITTQILSTGEDAEIPDIRVERGVLHIG